MQLKADIKEGLR